MRNKEAIMKRKIVSIITVLALCLNLCPAWALAINAPAPTEITSDADTPTDDNAANAPASTETTSDGDTQSDDNAANAPAPTETDSGDTLSDDNAANAPALTETDSADTPSDDNAANTPAPTAESGEKLEARVASVTIDGVTTSYATINAAWAAATGASAATVTLLTDVTTDTQLEVESGDITFSGGEHSLTMTDSSNYMFKVSGGKLNITNGTFLSPNSSGEIGAVNVYGSGEVIINGCTFEKNVNVAGGTVTVTNSTIQSYVKVIGGKVTVEYSTIQSYVAIDGTSTVELKKSTVEQQVTTRTGTVTFNDTKVKSYITVNSGTVMFIGGTVVEKHITVNGGTVQFNDGTFQSYVNVEAGTTTLNGGTFNESIAVTGGGKVGDLLSKECAYFDKDNNIIADGDQAELSGYGAITVKRTADVKICDHNWDSNGKCTKCKKQAAAIVTIGNQISYYPILQSAVHAVNRAAATNSDSTTIQITLLKEPKLSDVELLSGVELAFISPNAGEITLDGNGKTLDGYSVKISSADGDGSTAQPSGGTVKLINCKIKAENGSAVTIEGGAVKIDSGTFTGKTAIMINGANLTLADLLAENRFYFDSNEQMVDETTLSGKMLPTSPTSDSVTYTVRCAHREVNENENKFVCSECGKTMAATVTASGAPVYYAGIEDAWTAAKTAKTAAVNLLQDVTVTDALTVEDGENITLTSAKNNAGEDFSISRTTATSLDKTIMVSGGRLCVESGKIQMTSTKNSGNYFALHIKDGAAEITGGAIVATGIGSQNVGVYVESGAAKITGGTITATGDISQNTGVYVGGGTAEITGGAISATGNRSVGVNVASGTAKITISGGAISATGENGVGVSGWYEDNVKLMGGTFQGESKAIECISGFVSSWLERTDAAHYAYYQNDAADPMKENDIKVNALTGKVEVKQCKGACTYTRISGTETHITNCPVCNYNITRDCAYDQQNTHEKYKISDATCTETAKYYQSCFCGVKGTTIFSFGSPLGHKWKDAACTTPKTCSVCNTTEGDPLGHDWATTWSSDETNHWHTCSRCSEIKDTAAHTPDREAATETEPVKCSVCEYVIAPALGHTHNWATAWSSDKDNHWHACSGCSEKNDSAAHTPDRDAATETEPVKCSVCKYVITPALGHTHNWATAWSSDKDNHWHACGGCSEKNDSATHTPGDWITDQAATIEAEGTKHKECTVCKRVMETGTIPQLTPDHQHSYSETWKFDTTNHWKECECGAKSESSAHRYDSNTAVACNVCGYRRTVEPEKTQTYAIIYDANGGAGTMPASTAIENIAFMLPSCGFIAPEGKVFDTWFIGGTNGAAVKPGEKYTFTTDTTVRAVWKDAPTVTYTVAYNANGGNGDVPTTTNLPEGGTFRLPGSLTREGYQFSGWNYGGVNYEADTVFTMPNNNVTFTAQWTQMAYAITGTVLQNSAVVPGATVRLMHGAQEITRLTTDQNGRFIFNNIPVGLYNLVVEQDGITKTVKQEITDNSAGLTTELPTEKISSVVEVKNEATPPVVVGELDKVFENETNYTQEDKEIVQQGGSVEFKLTVEKQEAPAEATKIEEIKQEHETVGLYLDLTLTKAVTRNDIETNTNISEIGTLIATLVSLPTEMQGKAGYAVYRVHDGKTESLPKDNGDEYYTVNDDKTSLSIFAKRYSTYAIAWSETVETPPTEDNNNGGESGGSNGGGSGSSGGSSGGGSGSSSGSNSSGGSSGGGSNSSSGSGNGGNSTPVPPTNKDTPKPDDNNTKRPAYKDYTDLPNNAWYQEAVDYVLQNGLMNGYSSNIFAPEDHLSRAMLAQILYNKEGKPAVTGNNRFADIDSAAWYINAVTWAATQGIVNGYGNNRFAPNDNITREQLAVMLWRYAGSPAVTEKELSFSDVNEMSEWAIDALCWAVKNRILQGKGNGILDPKGFATRAQAAQMLYNFMNL